MFEVGKEYKTRDGRRARIYATDAGGDFTIHGAVVSSGPLECWVLSAWNELGKHFINIGDDDDLMPPQREVFVVYLQGQVHCTSDTLEGAESFVKNSFGFEIVKFVEATDAN